MFENFLVFFSFLGSSDVQFTLPISGIISHAPQVDLQSKQVNPLPTSLHTCSRDLFTYFNGTQQALHMDAPGTSLKRSSHVISLRQSNHPFGRQYSRRSSSTYSGASPSNWKASPLYGTRLSFKPESKDLPIFPYGGSRIFQESERIRSSSMVENSVSGDVRKMECRICQTRLRKSPFDSSSSTDLSIVAVLVCGHVYHAECLEQKTSHEDRQDPPCPLCVAA